MSGKTAGLIIIGDEILKGQVKDTNSHFMCKRFRALGTKVLKISVVEDTVEEIAKTVKEFSERYDIVVTSGGIGSTHDDVTFAGVSLAFNDEIICNESLLNFWKKILSPSLEESAKAFSSIPKTAKLIWTDTQSVLFVDSEGKDVKILPVVNVRNVFVLPGIPSYLEFLFISLEKKYFQSHGRSFYTGRIYLVASEELCLKALNQSVEELKDCVFGSYPVVGNAQYKTQITVEAESVDRVKAAEDYFKALIPPQWIASVTDNMTTSVYKFPQVTADPQFAASLLKSIKLVEEAFERYAPENILLSFNGGKDCTVLLHIILAVKEHKGISEPLQIVYFRPTNPFPEIEQFIDTTVARYQLKLTALAGPIKSALVGLTQQKPNVESIFLGTRRSDPFSEDLNYFEMTDPGWTQLMRVNPVLDWSYRDIWTFLRGIVVPYCSLYDQGYTSLGNKDNTRPNPNLRQVGPDGKESYQPAWMLTDDSVERHGRSQPGLDSKPSTAEK